MRPIFSNKMVFLFPSNPIDNAGFSTSSTVSFQGSLWMRDSTGIVLETIEFDLGKKVWVKIAVPGGVGWIGGWNITLVE